MGNSGYTFMRRVFCWLNLLFWFCGCAFLGIGVWLRLSYQGYATLLPDHAALSADSIFITVGVMSFVVSFFGCCGSWFESRFLLILYFGLIILIFLSEFMVAALIFLFRNGLMKTLANELRTGIEKHYNATDKGTFAVPSVASIWDNIQNDFHCCGVTSYEDWYKINAWPKENWVPESCCRKVFNDTLEYEGSGTGNSFKNTNCAKSRDPTLWWDRGCAQNIMVWFIQRLHVVGSIGLTIAFFQLFGLITSMLLFCTMKHKQSSHTYKSYSPTIDQNNGTAPRHRDDSFLDD